MKGIAGLFLMAVLGLAGTGHAQENAFPSKPIRIVVGAPAGGPGDLVARTVGQKMGEILGQPAVVENRPGAGSTLAANLVARSAPDGYTLLLISSAHALTPSLYENLSYHPTDDFEPVGRIGTVPLVIMANKDLPANSIQELIALARAKPDFINFSSSGIGSSQHITVELMMRETGTRMVHVPFKGTAPAVASLIGGQVHVMVDPLLTAAPYVQSDRTKALAIIAPQRSKLLPTVPTMIEAGLPTVDTSGWYGLLAAGGTPAAIVEKLNAALNATLQDPNVSSSLASQGLGVETGPGPALTELIAEEIEKWRPVIESAGIRAE